LAPPEVGRFRVVLDTNVIVAGLRSRKGASFLVLDLVERGELSIILNAPLIEEYEDVIRRVEHRRVHQLSETDIHRFLRGLNAVAEMVETRLHRRLTMTRDPDDAVVAEAAIDGRTDYLVTHNVRHFAEVADRISVVTPGQLLRIMSE
jgi:putative PIN family toxin of toxin-antitoxin system